MERKQFVCGCSRQQSGEASDHGSSIDTVRERISRLRIDGNILCSYSVGDSFMRNIFKNPECQLEKYKSIHHDTYLWCLQIRNWWTILREALLQPLSICSRSFSCTVLQILYLAGRTGLDPKITVFLDAFNFEYIFDPNCFLPTHVKNIQNKSTTLLFFPDYPKNSYIYDFYRMEAMQKQSTTITKLMEGVVAKALQD